MGNGVGGEVLWYLESLDVVCYILCAFVLVLRRKCDLPSSIGDSSPVSIELSKVVILGEVERRMDCHGPNQHRDLRQISIRAHFDSTPPGRCQR